MTIVLTNDDGVDAPGMQALQAALQQLDQTAVVIAPQGPWSGCSHQVTTAAAIQVQQRSPSEYAISGTPADCVRLALSHFCPQVRWVLSGINAGGNLGADVYISGTVAAVREAALHRIPGIALSQYRRRQQAIDWQRSTHLAVKVLQELWAKPLPPGSFWNVNLPHLNPEESDPPLVFCNPCSQPLPVYYRQEQDQFYYSADYSLRKRDPNSDVEVCFSGQIAVSQCQVTPPSASGVGWSP
jgi:5'-nucleotidase